MTPTSLTKSSQSAEREAAEALRRTKRLVVLTGAGISKESGIPTFRDLPSGRDAQTGLWEKFNAEDLATREGFLSNPKMVWDWYDFRRNKIWGGNPNSDEGAKPNPGHIAIAELEKRVPQFTLVTQNIDNLHATAGNQNILELHGNIFRYKCLEKNHPLTLEDFAEQTESPPRCRRCQSENRTSPVRPDVVWFGEMLPADILDAAFHAASLCDVMLVVGTSGVVHPAAAIPVMAQRAGATMIEVNPEPSQLTDAVIDIFLQGPSGEILPRLLQLMETDS